MTENIAIGNYLEAHDAELVAAEGFQSVLSLDGSMLEVDPASSPFSMIKAFSLIDGPGNDPDFFVRVVDTLGILVRDYSPVLVHCHAGRSRSVVAVAGFLMRKRGLDYYEALDLVRSKREVALTPGIEGLLTHV